MNTDYSRSIDKWKIPGPVDSRNNEIIDRWEIPRIEYNGSGFEPGGVFLSNQAKKFIHKHQNKIVDRVAIGVTPVDSVIQFLLNIFTAGKLEKKLDRIGIEDLIHPYIVFILKDGGLLRFERIKRIEMTDYIKKLKDERYFTPYIEGRGMTLGHMIKNHIISLGGSYDRIIEYDPRKQNSQVFVKTFLDANNMNSIELEKFYKQPTDRIMANFHNTNDLVKKLTLLGISLDVIVGHGIDN